MEIAVEDRQCRLLCRAQPEHAGDGGDHDEQQKTDEAAQQDARPAAFAAERRGTENAGVGRIHQVGANNGPLQDNAATARAASFRSKCADP